MKVILKYNTPLHVASDAIRECYNTHDNSDTVDGLVGPKDESLIHRVGVQYKHGSTLEHLTISYSINGISRALLQELARHRIASLSVKSTRFTLQELTKENIDFKDYLYLTGDKHIDDNNIETLEKIRELKINGVKNDTLKYMLPEAYLTSLTYTINVRSLSNLLLLRTDKKKVLKEFVELANEMFNVLPENYKKILKSYIKD